MHSSSFKARASLQSSMDTSSRSVGDFVRNHPRSVASHSASTEGLAMINAWEQQTERQNKAPVRFGEAWSEALARMN